MEPANTQTVRLVTLNCFGIPMVRQARSRLKTIGRELNRSDLDVICLQEVHLRRYIPLLTHALNLLPHHAFEPFLYAPKGGLLTVSRHPIERRHFITYRQRGKMHSPALADWILHKGILISEIRVGDAPIVVVNTHLVANYRADWSRTSHYVEHERAELEQLRSVLDGIDRDRLVVVAGDFNVPTDAPFYQDFVRAAELVDPLAESREPTYRPMMVFPQRYAQTLDHVLVRPPRGLRIDVSASLVLRDRLELVSGGRSHVSDHVGIETTVQLAAE